MTSIVPGGPADEMELLEALRRGDEAAFVTLVGRYHQSLVRMASLYVSSQAAAEDVAQETWLGVLRGLERFEGRSSLKTWIFRIVINRARTRGERDRRSIPFSALASAEHDGDEPAVESERFLPAEHPRWPHHWASFPDNWAELPEQQMLSAETRAIAQRAIDALPPTQRAVITLRDIEGWASADICNVLVISETNQRVLLHRARSTVRRALERYFNEELGGDTLTGTLEEMTCQELVELVTNYLDGALPPLEHQRFEAHLDACDGCAAYVDQMRRTIQLIGKLAVDDIPADEQVQLLKLFRDWRSAGG